MAELRGPFTSENLNEGGTSQKSFFEKPPEFPIKTWWNVKFMHPGEVARLANHKLRTFLVSRMISVIWYFGKCWVPKLDSACLTLSKKNQRIGLQSGESKGCSAKVGFHLFEIEREKSNPFAYPVSPEAIPRFAGNASPASMLETYVKATGRTLT